MTAEQAIEAGYQQMIQHMTRERDRYLSDAKACPADFEHLDTEDVYIWLMESF